MVVKGRSGGGTHPIAQRTEKLQNVLASGTIAVLILELIYGSPIKSMVASLLGKFKPEIDFVRGHPVQEESLEKFGSFTRVM